MSRPIGIFRDLPAEHYHADEGSVSNTMLSAMNKSPAHCYALHIAPGRPLVAPTAAMSAGTLAHVAILEPHKIEQCYVVKPQGLDYSTKDGKAWRDAQTSPIVERESLVIAQSQNDAFLNVRALSGLMKSGEAELSVFWKDESTGLRCRARPDWLHWHGAKRATVLDVKTISYLTPESVQRAISTYGYHRQEAHYTNGLRACGIEVEEFVFGFVSSSYPFLAVAYVLDDETKQQGRDEVAELLDRFDNCKMSGEWPAFGEGYQLTGLPTWAKRTSELEIEVIQ